MPTITIHSIQFEATAPYADGHICTAVEAAVLNSARHENLRNNFGKKLSALLQAAGIPPGEAPNQVLVEGLRAEFRAYDARYTFSAPLPPRRSLDAVGRAAYNIAKDIVTAALRKRDLAPSDLSEGLFDQHIAAVAAKPEVRAEAERRVNATRSIAADALELGGI